MKIYYMRQEVLEDLKNNADENIEYYLNDNNDWIYERFDSPFLEFKRSVPDFELNYNPDSVGESDLENVKILHGNLKELTRTEAADERLWSGLTHSIFWDYMRIRWERRPVSKVVDIENRFFLRGKISNRRALSMNTLSRLWWIGEILYSPENKEDPYYLLELFRGDFTTNIHTLMSSSFTSNPKIVKAVLNPILVYKESHGEVSRKEFQGILRHANLLGGSYLLDYLEGYEIEDKINMYIDKVILKDTGEDREDNRLEDIYLENRVQKKRLFGGV